MFFLSRRISTTKIQRFNWISIVEYRIQPIESKNQITVPNSMIKNIEKQRAKKVFREEREENPPGDRTKPPIVTCKRSNFNHFPGQEYRELKSKNVASAAWQHRLSKGDFFTIDHHEKNPSWNRSDGQTFEQLQFSSDLIDLLKKSKIFSPTTVQTRAIPQLRTGRHSIVAGETGGGKTLAYLLPLIESLQRAKTRKDFLQTENAPFAIILVPTRELIEQIEKFFEMFRPLEIHLKSLIGVNTDRDPLNFSLGQVDLLVATPGVLLRLLRQDEHFGIERRLIGSNLRHIIVDEADTLLDITFGPAVVEIIRRLEVDVQPVNDVDHQAPPAVQLVFVSATIPTSTEETLQDLISTDQIDRSFTPDVHRIQPHVPQKFYRVGPQQKLNLLLKLVKYDLEKKHPCLIFCNQTKTVQFLQQFFRDNRIEIVTLHSQMTDTKRKRNFEKFRLGENLVMCSTDILSRGIDTHWVEHVIQFDFPQFVSDYIHRAGRVGRVGSKRPGKVSSFISRPGEISVAQKLEVTARLNRKLTGVNNDIKKQLALQTERRNKQEEKIQDRQKREELCLDVIRSAMN